MKRRQEQGAVLLIASNFPPVIGGSARVYAQLAREADGRIRVLSARRSYVDGRELSSWQAFDKTQPYLIERLDMLRTPLTRGGEYAWPQKLRLHLGELALRMRLMATLFRRVYLGPIRSVCIGELVANGWIAQWLRYWPGIRTVIYVHGEELTTEDGYDADGARRRGFLRAADAVIAVSRFTQQTLHRFAGDDLPVKVISNGVDFARFSRAESGHWRGRLGWEGCFVFLSVCRLVEKKGVDHALRAFARIARRRPEVRYLVAGQGEDEPRLRDIAEQEGIADRVVFAGRVEEADLPACYRTGDVFVMPNRRLPNGDTEGFGLVFLEANAAGLPVIAGRDGGSVDAVRDAYNGLVVEGASVDAVEAAMLRLLDDAGLRRRLTQNGLRHAHENDWSHKSREFLQLCLGET
ncbi:glycosyltransferase family 4 protein [Acidihalobacter ferrooxydans]|uniref:Glycosyl transferase family 1 n=1 Tax=Acidihalobacter ferrooxydans TaxID=1765967 RepID=A0A1P8UI15_9GAMM|nr:glycosyltransferase family 4 protein [Acidihalobacter ferrooxydans]APZ43483.1 hypothetical protein BW247_10600 [Acidihalobacter ferrooxydans]